MPANAFSTSDSGRPVVGLRGDYFDDVSPSASPVFTRIDPRVDAWFVEQPDIWDEEEKKDKREPVDETCVSTLPDLQETSPAIATPSPVS